MIDIKEDLLDAVIVLGILCTGYSIFVLPCVVFLTELTKYQLQLALCSTFLIAIAYWLIVFLILGIRIIAENIKTWCEMKKDWEQKKNPPTRVCEDKPATRGFERKMTPLTTKEENDD